MTDVVLPHPAGPLAEILGVGIDLEDVGRWERILATIPPRQLDAMFSADEQRCCNGQTDRAGAYAGKWCAKEAVRKATSWVAPISLRHIVVLNDASGAPQVAFEGSGAFEHVTVQVSITHSPTSAAAVAIALARSHRGSA